MSGVETPQALPDAPSVRHEKTVKERDALADVEYFEPVEEDRRTQEEVDRSAREENEFRKDLQSRRGPIASLRRLRMRGGVFGIVVAIFECLRTLLNARKNPVPFLIEFLLKEDESRRERAASKLGELGAKAEEAVEVLTYLSEYDPQIKVRTTAAEALKKIDLAIRAKESRRNTNR